MMQLDFALDGLVVYQGTIGTVEIADKRFAVALDQGAVALADHRACRAEMALGIPTYKELG
jgi:hypothetical protein